MTADSPAFLFYVADYLLGTKLFTLEEDGAYLRCLCHQWDTGSVPGDSMKDMASLMRVTKGKAAAVWAVVGKKFRRGDDGLWRNVRMETERTKYLAKREKRVEAGRNGGLAKASNARSSPEANPREAASNARDLLVAKSYQTPSKALANDLANDLANGQQTPSKDLAFLGLVQPRKSKERSSSEEIKNKNTHTAPLARRRTPVEQLQEPDFKTALAIAHRVIEVYARVDWVSQFKHACIEQGLNYAAAAANERPLYERALEAAEGMRNARAARMARAEARRAH